MMPGFGHVSGMCSGPVIPWRFAARVSGLALGLGLAVRPAGSAETPRARVGPGEARWF
jgi:hypothetical protein